MKDCHNFGLVDQLDGSKCDPVADSRSWYKTSFLGQDVFSSEPNDPACEQQHPVVDILVQTCYKNEVDHGLMSWDELEEDCDFASYCDLKTWSDPGQWWKLSP